ncbi:MAG: substrate-binding domain-containing protein [Arenimonas sp.]
MQRHTAIDYLVSDAMNLVKILCAALLWLGFLCEPATAQDTIRINGSNTLGDRMVPILVEGWMKKIGYGNIIRTPAKGGRIKIGARRDDETLIVEISGNGSRAGFQDLVTGGTEIAMMSRALSVQEIDDGWQLGSLNSPDQEHVIGLQAMTVIVHPSNRVTGLDMIQLSKIIAGQITDWRQVGGKPGPIRLHIARQGTGLAELQASILPGRVTAGNIERHGNAKAIRATVAADPNSLGIDEFSVVTDRYRVLPMRVAGRLIPADHLHIKAEDYPLMRRLYFYTGQIVTALGRGFLLYAESDEGQRLLASHGYLSLAPMLFAETGRKDLPTEYSQWTEGASRLSFSFRFGNAFSIFDSRGAQDLARLKDFMRRPENKNRKVILVGHSDKQSSAYIASSVSNEYADLVATALTEIGINPMRVRGVGYTLPLSSAGNAVYRNRRVEIWVR